MIDLMTGVQNAIYAALEAGVPDNLGGVKDHVPEGTAPPFNKIGSITGSNEGSKDQGPVRFEIEVHSIWRGPSRGPLLQMIHAVKEAIMEGTLSAPGIVFGDLDWLDDGVSEAAADGVTYAGINVFELYAEAA